ncbi:hypothetical protein HYG86_10170 [Alkalicella caledoniensis]|uniref:Uncharacterized protein n=1 Tax=Alkalicella caledoniensis TaxID=2731377 RepID=A0A7G9W8T8_ALKCA|nr:hypothetical protein [Alkalicella caledoniensis]QNO15100.1 hypothetical protein HYG86_10170 [Alkalicella caledoniensis]
MTAYQKLINELIEKKGLIAPDYFGEIEEVEENEAIENLEPNPSSDDAEYNDSMEDVEQSLKEELAEKLGDYKKNMPLFEVLFTDVMKKNKVNLDEEIKDLNPEEKQGVLTLVLDLIKQFEDVERKEEVK